MKRFVCHIPSAYMLSMFPVRHWFNRFREFTRRTPTEIVLPAVGHNGPNYDSSIHGYPQFVSKNYMLPDWIRESRELVGDSGVVWVSIHPGLEFMNNNSLWVENQYADDLPQSCINKPITQSVVHDFTDEISQLGGVGGIVFDITDTHPNAGASGFEGVLCYCFCDFCRRDLSDKGFKEPASVFVGNNGIQRFVLRNDKDGTAHIDPSQLWIDQRDVKSLVAFAIARRFVETGTDDLERDAARLLTYLDARVRVTANAARELTSKCRTTSLRSAIILASSATDMSQMVSLSAIDRVHAADEYWLPDAPDRASLEGEWQALQFLSARSSYYINSFFETVEQANEQAISLGTERFLQSLLRKSTSLRANKLGVGAAYIAEKMGQYAGFVGVPFGSEDHLALITRLSSDVTGTVLPEKLLLKFRIGDPGSEV